MLRDQCSHLEPEQLLQTTVNGERRRPRRLGARVVCPGADRPHGFKVSHA